MTKKRHSARLVLTLAQYLNRMQCVRARTVLDQRRLGGATLLQRFSWLQFVLAALILTSGFRLLFAADDSADVSVQPASEHWAVRALSLWTPIYWSGVG